MKTINKKTSRNSSSLFLCNTLIVISIQFVFMFTSCESNAPINQVDILSNGNPINPIINHKDTIVADVPTVADKLSAMVDYLGVTVKTASTFTPSEAIKNGDVIEYSYYDDFAEANLSFAINQEKSTKDTIVFDGTCISLSSGQLSYHRHTIASTDDGIVVKKQVTATGKPHSENPGYFSNGNFKYIPSPVGIKKYKIRSDGSESFQCSYIPKSPTSVSKVYEGGATTDLSNVSVSKLQNINTGLQEVYM